MSMENGKLDKTEKKPSDSVLLNFRVKQAEKEVWQGYADEHTNGKMSRLIRKGIRDLIESKDRGRDEVTVRVVLETALAGINDKFAAILARLDELTELTKNGGKKVTVGHWKKSGSSCPACKEHLYEYIRDSDGKIAHEVCTNCDWKQDSFDTTAPEFVEPTG